MAEGMKKANLSEMQKKSLKKNKMIVKVENGKTYYNDGTVENTKDGIEFRK